MRAMIVADSTDIAINHAHLGAMLITELMQGIPVNLRQ
jgi:uncharacterized MnhB-related membrane protein